MRVNILFVYCGWDNKGEQGSREKDTKIINVDIKTETSPVFVVFPVDGNWGPWSGFNPCSVTCGTGAQSRTRSCDNPAPAYGGADCHGDGIETRSCNMIDCPVDGNWGTWSEFSTCCSVCSVVEQNRSRLCDNPVPAMGGADCPGDSVATKSCNSNDCLDNGSDDKIVRNGIAMIIDLPVSAGNMHVLYLMAQP
ncbi:hypothetical protein SNE40_003780 [Patella caerulea]|uniref:Uncharacterized protein n=1 Tax=Patella caerulea TaxID=87958 RepID=A0AAN8K8K4_PATCE